ncbi:MAG: sulfur carrier protein ThiS [Proteobacteria bacterium]|jgi:thiamine biosynthesis protein ThiS|nr:sulfur carrier protein ThiS [Pseudomonadota bacterium]
MITVNGRETPWTDGTTVASLLKDAGFVFPLLIVRVNGALVDREDYASRAVADDDTVEVVHLMSGG